LRLHLLCRRRGVWFRSRVRLRLRMLRLRLLAVLLRVLWLHGLLWSRLRRRLLLRLWWLSRRLRRCKLRLLLLRLLSLWFRRLSLLRLRLL